MSVVFATSAVLGFVREAVLAAYFGVSASYDALLVAMIIPSFLLAMLGEASMGAAIVPVFISYIAPEDGREQRRIIGSAFLLISLVLTVVTSLGIALAPQISRLLAPGFGPEQLELTTRLMRIMLPTVFILGLANFVIGLLHSLRRFGIAAATGVVFNLAMVLVTVPLARSLGIVAPALGVLIGATLQLAIMLPPLVREGLLPAVGTSFRDPALSRIRRLFLPLLGGALVVTVLQAVDKIVASYLPAGSLSALNFANKIAGGPPRIFTMAVAVVLFPEMARMAAEKLEHRGDLVVEGMTLAAFVTLPWMGIFIALRSPVTSVLLQRGAFDARATAVVAIPLAIYCVGEFASGIGTMVNNAFYAQHDSRVPTLIYVGANAARAVLIVVLVRALGYLAIPAGHVLAMNAQLLVLLFVLRRRHLPDLDLRRLSAGLAKATVASVAAGLASSLAYAPLAAALPRTFVGMLCALALACVPALLAYYLVARALGSAEAVSLERRIAALVRREVPPSDPGRV